METKKNKKGEKDLHHFLYQLFYVKISIISLISEKDNNLMQSSKCAHQSSNLDVNKIGRTPKLSIVEH